jgi:hypothetical protein
MGFVKKSPFMFHSTVYELPLQENLDLAQGKEFLPTPRQGKLAGMVAPLLFPFTTLCFSWLATVPINNISQFHHNCKLHSA